MKKDYVKPSIEWAEIEVQSMMATSDNVFSISISDDTTDEDASMAGERRGSWGSLWD